MDVVCSIVRRWHYFEEDIGMRQQHETEAHGHVKTERETRAATLTWLKKNLTCVSVLNAQRRFLTVRELTRLMR